MLIPGLKHGDIAIMDNLTVHKVTGAREANEAAGAYLICRPPYGPDLNAIERDFSKVKAILRKAAARTIKGLSGLPSPTLSMRPRQKSTATSSPAVAVVRLRVKML
jgi:transposase